MSYITAKLNTIDQTKKIIQYWNNIIPMIKNDTDKILVHEISKEQANSYKGDLMGILKNIIQVPDELIYPNILINGYKSSSEFNGLTTRILTYSRETLLTHYEIISGS